MLSVTRRWAGAELLILSCHCCAFFGFSQAIFVHSLFPPPLYDQALKWQPRPRGPASSSPLCLLNKRSAWCDFKGTRRSPSCQLESQHGKAGLGKPKTAFADDRPPISFDLKHGLGDDKRGKSRNWKETPEQEGSKKVWRVAGWGGWWKGAKSFFTWVPVCNGAQLNHKLAIKQGSCTFLFPPWSGSRWKHLQMTGQAWPWEKNVKEGWVLIPCAPKQQQRQETEEGAVALF